MENLSENLRASQFTGYSGRGCYVKRDGLLTTFYMRLTQEVARMVSELKLGSSEGGLIPMVVPNGYFPPAVTIYDSEHKVTELIKMLKKNMWEVVIDPQAPLENRI